MKQNQRFVLFLILSMGIFIAWINLGPRFFPDIFPKPPKKKNLADGEDEGRRKTDKKTPPKKTGAKKVAAKDGPVEARKPVALPPKDKAPKPPKKAEKKQEQPDVVERRPKFPRHPERSVILGSLDPESGFFLQVKTVSSGAAVESIRLNDERYRSLENLQKQLTIIGNSKTDYRTFETRIPAIDRQLRRYNTSLRSVHWAVGDTKTVDEITTDVTYTFTSPDGLLKVSKRYWLQRVDLAGRKLQDAQDGESKGYELKFSLTIENLDSRPRTVSYKLQGPVGVPLENADNARVHRGIVTGFVQGDGSIKSSRLTAEEVVTEDKDWDGAIRYIGVDVQYFVTLIVPEGDEAESRTIQSAVPEVLKRDLDEIEHSDITLELTSVEFTLGPKGGKDASTQHTFTLFAGPKRKPLLQTYGAEGIISYSWYAFVAPAMLWLLNLFHNIGIGYGLAIICLTIVVRAALYPLSRKQAISANRMKELQPKIAELKKKYGDDREKLARAQMELFAKHGYNPLAGCLPIFLQLPIFIGLYQALINSVDLRLAPGPFPLLWIENLAAPDALFDLGFRIPWLGWTTFNLLPLVTVVLFIVQQKMFMPPPTDEQQAMQQKMMSYMSVFFGFLFYRVPSGLCIYFIASSLWGLCERKLLDKKKSASAESETGTTGNGDKKPGAKKGTNNEPDKPKGFFGKLMEMADEAAKAKARGNGNAQSGKPEREKTTASSKPRGRGKKGRKNRKSRR